MNVRKQEYDRIARENQARAALRPPSPPWALCLPRLSPTHLPARRPVGPPPFQLHPLTRTALLQAIMQRILQRDSEFNSAKLDEDWKVRAATFRPPTSTYTPRTHYHHISRAPTPRSLLPPPPTSPRTQPPRPPCAPCR